MTRGIDPLLWTVDYWPRAYSLRHVIRQFASRRDAIAHGLEAQADLITITPPGVPVVLTPGHAEADLAGDE